TAVVVCDRHVDASNPVAVHAWRTERDGDDAIGDLGAEPVGECVDAWLQSSTRAGRIATNHVRDRQLGGDVGSPEGIWKLYLTAVAGATRPACKRDMRICHVVRGHVGRAPEGVCDGGCKREIVGRRW